MDIPTSILSCLCGVTDEPVHRSNPSQYAIIDSKPPIYAPPSFANTNTTSGRDLDLEALAAEIAAILRQAEKPGAILARELDDTVDAAGWSWSERLAEAALHALEQTLKMNRESWGQAMGDAYDRAAEIAAEVFAELIAYVREHPVEVAATVLLSLVAFGVLVRLAPLILELLGFGLEGPIEGSFAAWFQSTYRGFVPKGSIMSFLQRLGMTWGK